MVFGHFWPNSSPKFTPLLSSIEVEHKFIEIEHKYTAVENKFENLMKLVQD